MGLIARAQNSMKRYKGIDVLRKSLFVATRPWRAVVHYGRRVRFYFFTKCWVHYILGKVRVNTVGHYISIGKEAALYHNTVFELTENAQLQIGSNFTLSYGALISCQYKITIGNYVMVGEYSSIRDTSHVYNAPGIPYCKQHDVATEIVIKDNVWIGRGTVILPGTVIEEGVIVAANSVVKGTLEPFSMYGGVPAKFIKKLPVSA